MAERCQLPRSCVPPTTRRKDCGRSPSGGSEGGKTRCIGSAKTWSPFKGITLLLKATLPTCVLSHRGLSLLQHAPWSPPYDMGAGSHASCKLAQGRKSQTAARGACNCPAVTSIPPLSPKPTGERADSHAVSMQPRQVGAPLRLQRAQHGGPGPHVMQPARRLLRASNCTAPRATTAPPRLRNIGHGPVSRGRRRDGRCGQKWAAVMAVAGRQKQRSRRQPSSRPLMGQRENPLPRREDGAPVIRSLNGSRTRNGCPVNHSPRHINSAAGQAAPLVGEAGDASPPP
jgi:hypothetical protein